MISTQLSQWETTTRRVLGEIRMILERKTFEPSISVQANIIFAVTPFTSHEEWSTTSSRAEASSSSSKAVYHLHTQA
jgi:hypothetical protein